MIKKISVTFLILALAQVSFAAEEDKILAKVDGKAVHESEIKDTISTYANLNAMGEDTAFNYDTLTQEVKGEIVKSIIVGELVLDEAKKIKTNESPEYKQALQFAEKQLIQKFFLDKLIKENITEAKMKERYEQIAKQQAQKEEYKVSHILVKTEEEAKDIKGKLDKGGDFVALAKEYSLDGNKDNGGSLGYFGTGQMVPAFEEATAQLKIGTISAPVKTDFGYHIIKLEDKRKAHADSFEKMRSKIYDMMAAQFIQDYIAQLQTQNKVEFF
jgi:parvulin-like peptidyl-prolyl isomerase